MSWFGSSAMVPLAAPEETARSVFAEIVAHRSGRSGAPLRSHGGPIHLQPS